MDKNIDSLSKKERKEFFRKEKEQHQKQEKKKQRIVTLGIGIVISLLIIAGGWYIVSKLSQPLPGTAVPELGRKHVDDGTKVEYNSNPPTSGDHFAEWTKAGIYKAPISDGHLLHALEHGYIIVSYNCMKLNSKFKVQNSKLIRSAYAHEEDLEASSSAGSQPGEELKGEVWESKECKDLAKQLSDIANEVRLWKLIVIPRPVLDVPIALTAWGRIDKMEKLDKERIVRFITAFRDQGPEKTVE